MAQGRQWSFFGGCRHRKEMHNVIYLILHSLISISLVLVKQSKLEQSIFSVSIRLHLYKDFRLYKLFFLR